MPTLYDRQNNPVEIPEDQVQQAVASGKYAYAQGETVIMAGKAGELYDVPAQEVSEMYNRGFRVESGAEAEERELQEEYGGTGSQILTAGHAVGNTLSFGGLDAAGAAIFGEDYTEPVKKLKQANPDLHTGLELATIAGSFLLPGGQAAAAGKLAKFGKGFRSGGAIRKVAKIGRNVENAAYKKMGGPGGGMMRQALAKGGSLGLGAGVEGSIYGAGQFLSEASLGETDATAENLLSNMGMGAMWGGIAGGGMGAGGQILKRGFGAGANFAKRSSKSIKSMWEKATGRKAFDGVEAGLASKIDDPISPSLLDEIGAKVTGADPKAIATLKDPKMLDTAMEADRILNQKGGLVDETANVMDEIRTLSHEAHEQGMGKLKYKNVKELMDEADHIAVNQTNTGMLGVANKELDGALMAGKERFDSRGAIQDVKAMINRADDEIRLAIKSKGTKATVTQFEEMDRLKRYIDNKVERLTNMRNKNYADDETIKMLTARADDIRVSLMDEKLYGKTAAGFQKEVNAGWVQKLRKPEMSRRFQEEYAREAFKKIRVTDRRTVKSTYRDYGMPDNKYQEEFMSEWAENEIRVAKTLNKYFDLGPEMKANITKLDGLQGKLGGLMKEAERTIGLKNQLADIVTRSNQLRSVMGPVAGVGLGYALGGGEGAAIGLGLSVMTNPGRMLQLRSALNRMSSQSELGVVKAIKGYIKKATGKIKPSAKVKGIIAPASLKILGDSNWGEKRTKDKNKYEAFNRRSEELTSFLSNPEKTMDRLKTNVGDVSDVAPNIATAMQVKAVQAARYLYDRMPKPLTENALLTGKFKPSDVDLAKFERIAAVIDNPENALKSLHAGMLTVEEVEALKANYPQMYEQIVTTLAEQIPELREDLPYKERVQLSILFEVPVDATMEPEFLTAMQAVNMIASMPQGEAPGPKQPKTKLGKYSDISLDTASQTESQRVEINKTA